MLKFILIAGLGYLFWRVYKSGAFSKITKNPNKADDVLVYDPFCKVYHLKRESVPLKHKGKVIHFCSKNCRDGFLDFQKRQSLDEVL